MSVEGDVSEGLGPLRATVVEYKNRPAECTIHPVDPPAERRATAWITAQEGSYAALSTCR
ncbi:DUF7511 domain-containing protein [Halobellus sp. GM3]|uniref:DUF7511 domain-containing protein n=1 Tax=Halobellus sp. GM3 TaxID=3458410 RepID=UPI00403DFF97